jgi:hypothetical protein
MSQYVILTNRKRAIIALVHTVAFLGLAALTGMLTVHALGPGSPASAWTMATVYVLVSLVLLVLTAFSGNAGERIYFSLCAASAGFGLARQLLGDGQIHAAVYARVLLLICAAVTCVMILRAHSDRPDVQKGTR